MPNRGWRHTHCPGEIPGRGEAQLPRLAAKWLSRPKIYGGKFLINQQVDLVHKATDPAQSGVADTAFCMYIHTDGFRVRRGKLAAEVMASGRGLSLCKVKCINCGRRKGYLRDIDVSYTQRRGRRQVEAWKVYIR